MVKQCSNCMLSSGGEVKALVLIYHSDVFAPGAWCGGLLMQGSGGSLISGRLLADIREVAHFVTIAASLSLSRA